MTLEPAMLAVHERLEEMASAMPTPDVDAGWAALTAALEPAIAPVIPIRPRSHVRALAVGVAAAMLVAGAALAATTGGGDTSTGVAPIETPAVPIAGPHLHRPFEGPPAVEVGTPGEAGGAAGGGTGEAPSGAAGGSTEGADAPEPGDDPADRDQGTGNDGAHDDQGGGNDGHEGTSRGH